MSSSSNIELSIIIPVLNESENLPALFERLLALVGRENVSYEIIFIDDGSSDESLDIICGFIKSNTSVSCIEFTRNFGHQYALSAGLDFCRGRACVLMDADLQDAPEVISDFLQKWREGYQVVYAVRGSREESFLKNISYKLYYRILKSFASIDLPLDAGDFCLLDRKAVDLMRNLPEKNRFLRGLRSWIGLKQYPLVVERQARFAGAPQYSLSKLITLGMDGIIAFSFIPLRVISLCGLFISLFSVVLAAFYVIKKITIGLNPPGFATIVVLISFFSGVQLVTLGIIGEYISRIFSEVKNRPLYLVKRVIRSGENQNINA